MKKTWLNKLFGIEEEKTREEKLKEVLSSLKISEKQLFDILTKIVREDILPSLGGLVDKKEKVTRQGHIEDHFTFLGEDYVAFSPDPKSNYLPIASNYWRDIENPLQKILVESAYSFACQR